MQDPYLNPDDLSNGHYPHLRKVGAEDPEFLDVVSWLEHKGAPPFTRFYVPKGLSLDGANAILPTEMHWESSGRETLKLDAALVFNFPHVALTELKRHFGFGDPNVLEMYPGPRQPVSFVTVSPIGESWPEQGSGVFRPASADHYEYGAVYVDPTGEYRKEKRHWAFVPYGVWVKAA
jgi:hypothetical protein